jgi:integrase
MSPGSRFLKVIGKETFKCDGRKQGDQRALRKNFSTDSCGNTIVYLNTTPSTEQLAMPHLSPTTLTTDEQRLILRATAGNLRDHTVISLALGTGLRLAEIVGLNVGDVYAPDGSPRVRVRVRKQIAKGGRAADVFLPDRLLTKLKRYWRWKRQRGEDLVPDAPLFANQSGRRISKRRVQHAWAGWQRRAGFDRSYGFHALRHTAVTNVYRASRDLFLAQRFARHVSPLTTTVYTHPSDADLAASLRGLGC